MIDKNTFADYLYNRLPAVYREEDYKLGEPLYRYLQCLCVGGFNKVIEDSNNFLSIVDPETCSEEVFPYLYRSFGLKYHADIPAEYHRRFLSSIGALVKRRGTYASVRYLIRVLTGLEVELFYERQYDSIGNCLGRFLTIQLLPNTIEDIQKVQVSSVVIERFIKTQLPFYITPKVRYLLKDNEISTTIYRGSCVSTMIHSEITPKVN